MFIYRKSNHLCNIKQCFLHAAGFSSHQAGLLLTKTKARPINSLHSYHSLVYCLCKICPNKQLLPDFTLASHCQHSSSQKVSHSLPGFPSIPGVTQHRGPFTTSLSPTSLCFLCARQLHSNAAMGMQQITGRFWKRGEDGLHLTVVLTIK